MPDNHSLPVTYFRSDLRLFVWRPEGIVNLPIASKILVDLRKNEAAQAKCFNRYLDLSLMNFDELSSKYVFHVALYRRLSYAGQAPIKCALFVTNPKLEELVKVRALGGDHCPLRVEMFKDREAAAVWLNVPSEATHPWEC
jgi:hypothetical protein